MIKGGLQKRKKDENWYTYNSSTWVMDSREIMFQTRPQKSLFSVSETMHKLGGGIHTRAWSLCYYSSSSNLVWAEAPGQEFSYQPLPTGYSSGCSSVYHSYLVLARAQCRGTQRMDSSAQALQEKLCRDLLSFTSYCHTKRATSHDTQILWSHQLNPLRKVGTKYKRSREAQPDPLSQVETSKVISNPDKIYSTLLWELCLYVYDEETALHAAVCYFHLAPSFGNAHMWDCANNLFTEFPCVYRVIIQKLSDQAALEVTSFANSIWSAQCLWRTDTSYSQNSIETRITFQP